MQRRNAQSGVPTQVGQAYSRYAAASAQRCQRSRWVSFSSLLARSSLMACRGGIHHQAES